MRDGLYLSIPSVEPDGEPGNVADTVVGLSTGMLGGNGAMGLDALRFVEEAQTGGVGLLA